MNSSIADLLGFQPPPHATLPESVISRFLNAVKGKVFPATLLSRYGNTDYEDHNPTELRFSEDGNKLFSKSPGPDGSNASVAGPFRLKGCDDNGDYLIELQYECKTTFRLSRGAVNFGEEVQN
jgi:hypothetical protein